MKRSTLLVSVMALAAACIFSSDIMDSNGKYINTGSPGEQTCSQAGCHGAGNGNNSTGGLPDNAGPGNLTISCSNMNNWQYVPNTTYNMTVTVSQQGCGLFGFDFEALDNSGNTNPFNNNTAGSFTITDAVRTRMGQPVTIVNNQPVYGRWNVTHKLNGGQVPNSASFNFNWTAPSSNIGPINFYSAGNAANGDGFANSSDNVYSAYKQITPFVTGTGGIPDLMASVAVFPNPADDVLNVSYCLTTPAVVYICLYDLEGKRVCELENGTKDAGSFVQAFTLKDRFAPGCYLLGLSDGRHSSIQRVIIR